MNKEQNLQEGQPEKKVPAEVIPAEEASAAETKQPSDLNLKPSDPDMEVHHHTHAGHGKKTWKEYFWEFLMLFLAVFCGFLAEYQLEHLIEKNREKAYMKGIVENLKYDIIRCDNNSQNNIEYGLGWDSLRNELKNAIGGTVNANALYYYAIKYSEVGEAAFNTSSITELKNSGSLRLIHNKKIVADMADYYERKIYAAHDYLPSREQRDALQKTKNQFFSFTNLDGYIQSFNSISESSNPAVYDYGNILNHNPALRLLTNTPKELEILYTQVSLFEIRVKQYNSWLAICKKTAGKLITDIQKEYHLENE